ncbi:MAG: acyl-CoA dehydrogenase family protein [Chitinophagales bacterium]|nr:acyl-CoA dehydrogenase family protein [Chitinophagales bacterium]
MSQYFTEEHELFRQSAREFIQKEVIPNGEKWEAEELVPREVFKKMGEQGLLGINFPEQYGGTDNDFWYTVVWLEEIAKSKLAGFAAAVSVHQFMATNHILHAGSDALKAKYLPPSISGSYVGSIAISEPGAGSDVAAMRTTAKKEGDYYILNGNKTFITNGYYGNFVTVACKTDPDAGMAGISLIVVDQGTPGFTTSRLKKMGWKSSDTAELFFDNVKVPAGNLVGKEGQGFFYIMESFQLERLVAAIMAVAGAELVIEMTLKYMHERSAFGKPISKFQVLRHKMVDLTTEVEITKRFVYYCCDLFARGIFCVKECSMAKLKATELGKTVADECLQMFGGYGWMSEYPIERCYRDARVGTIVGGTTEIMKEIIAKMTVDGINYESAYKNMKSGGGESAKSEPATKPASGQTLSETQNNNSSTKTNGKMDKTPETARDIIYSLPQRLKADKVDDSAMHRFHFKLDGETGGNFTVTLQESKVVVLDGLVDEPTCEIKAKASDYEDLELGRGNPQMMFMMGKIKVSNLGEVMKFITYFSRIKS